MQATHTLEQIPRPPDRDTWLRSRHGYWNASSAATLTASHPYQSLTDEISRKARPWAPTPDNAAMRRGNHLEAGVADWLCLPKPELLHSMSFITQCGAEVRQELGSPEQQERLATRRSAR